MKDQLIIAAIYHGSYFYWCAIPIDMYDFWFIWNL